MDTLILLWMSLIASWKAKNKHKRRNINRSLSVHLRMLLFAPLRSVYRGPSPLTTKLTQNYKQYYFTRIFFERQLLITTNKQETTAKMPLFGFMDKIIEDGARLGG